MGIPRTAVICAVAALVAIAGVLGGGWDGVAYADGGSSARSQAASVAPDESGDAIYAYTQRILRTLADADANNWVRYWRARADCEAARAEEGATPMERVLLGLTGMLCARLDARLGVNPGDYLPRAGEERTVGLVASERGAAVGYTLFKGWWGHDVFLLDPLGRVAHAWRIDIPFKYAKLLDNGNLLAIDWGGIFEFDPRGNVVWQYNICCLHHDFLNLPNGNVLLLVRGDKTGEEAIAVGANPEFARFARIKYDYLIEVRPDGATGGEVVWEWSPWDHLVQDFDPTKPNYGVIDEHPELIDINFLLETTSEGGPKPTWGWLHINAIDYNPALDQIMLSPRHFSELWIIDHSATTEEAREHSGGNSDMGGDLLYRWGNPRAYGHGDVGDQRLFWQHQPHWIPQGLPGEGNILLFNNGNEFPGYRRLYSSVDELVLHADGYRYRRDPNSPYPNDGLAWTYVAETPSDFYAPLLSGAQRLPNRNTLIADGTAGTIFQIRRGGKVVWKYVAPLDGRDYLRQGERPSIKETTPTPYGDPAPLFNNSVYRAYWYPPDHPGLQALDLTPGAYIEDLPDARGRADAIVAAAATGGFGDPLARSDFDIYLDENKRRLIYIKRPCADEDARAKFFLHIIPADTRELPDYTREHGFDNFDFNFDGSEVQASDNWCVAMRRLPGYAIKRIRTGQFTDEGTVWQAEAELGE